MKDPAFKIVLGSIFVATLIYLYREKPKTTAENNFSEKESTLEEKVSAPQDKPGEIPSRLFETREDKLVFKNVLSWGNLPFTTEQEINKFKKIKSENKSIFGELEIFLDQDNMMAKSESEKSPRRFFREIIYDGKLEYKKSDLKNYEYRLEAKGDIYFIINSKYFKEKEIKEVKIELPKGEVEFIGDNKRTKKRIIIFDKLNESQFKGIPFIKGTYEETLYIK